jgi:hypothetical protein
VDETPDATPPAPHGPDRPADVGTPAAAPAPAADAAAAPRRRLPRRAAVLAGAAALVLLVAGTVAVAVTRGEPAAAPTSAPVAAPTPSPSPTATAEPAPAAVPAPPSPEALAALPLAFFDAVVPELLDGGDLTPTNQWTIATPRAALVALYASPSADAAPVATFGATVPTLNRPAATAVWGASPGLDGGMVLVATPARNATPGDGGVAAAPSATFAWARAADFTLSPATQSVLVDNASSVISVLGQDGAVSAQEVARLGSPDDPTPAGTATYMEANYVDPSIGYTQGQPIALTGAHSPLLAGYGGNSALTAIHYYPDPTGSSHGCVRVSAAMTQALATLPVGTPIQFT